MSKGKVALGVAVGLFSIYILAAPYITVYQMKSAVENYDGETLSEYIEFPSVRQSFKDQINVMVAMNMAKDEDIINSPFAALVMDDEMLDAIVTPAGITRFMAGQKSQPGAEQGDGNARSAERNLLSDTSMSYEAFDKFVVRFEGEDRDAVKFVLRRRGISWKLTDIIIPLE